MGCQVVLPGARLRANAQVGQGTGQPVPLVPTTGDAAHQAQVSEVAVGQALPIPRVFRGVPPVVPQQKPCAPVGDESNIFGALGLGMQAARQITMFMARKRNLSSFVQKMPWSSAHRAWASLASVA